VTGSLNNREPEWKIPLGRPWCRWEDNIKVDLREMGWEVVGWMHLDQDGDQWRTPVNTVMKLLVPYKAGNSSTR
jgi:hypothetical protein